MSKALFTLTAAESKRLIAKAIVNLPELKSALTKHKVIIAGGTTNGYIAEELLGIKLEKEKYTAGVVTQGQQCLTPAEERIPPVVLDKGQKIEKSWIQAVDEFTHNDIFIKGANAIDHEGTAGILVADPFSGTIGKVYGIIMARGSKLIMPVGIEKMIPSVKAGLEIGGIDSFDYHLGLQVGVVPVIGAKIVTELEALNILFGVKAVCLAAGGIGGSEGAVTIAIEGEDQQVQKAFEFIKNIKGEPALKALKQKCKCSTPCDRF